MTRRFLALACAVLFVSHPIHVRAQTALELTDRARKELQAFDDAKKAEIKQAEDANKKTPTAASMSNVAASHQEEFALGRALSTLQEVRGSLESGNGENALLELSHVAPFGNLPTEVGPVLDALRQRIRAEQTEKLTAYTKDTDSTVQRAAAAVLQAKEARDLDDSLKDLKRASELPVPGGNSSDERNVAARLRYAIGFVTHWQDYLIARSRNDDNEVRNILRNLTSETNVPLIARSEILARIPQTDSERETTQRVRRPDTSRSQNQIDADAREIVQKLQKLDDVAAALAKLVDLRTEETQSSHNYRSDSVLNAALQGLDALQRTILEYRNGLAPSIGRLLTGTEYASHPDINLTLWNLRLQLVRDAAPQLMGVPPDQKLGNDEPVGVYVHRLIESAKARQDWAAVIVGQQIFRLLSSSNGSIYGFGNELDTSAYQNLIAADNLEKAGQYEEAVSVYLTALRSGQAGLPATWIGEHLAAIQKAHPEEHAHARWHASGNPQNPAATPGQGDVQPTATSPSPTPAPSPPATPTP